MRERERERVNDLDMDTLHTVKIIWTNKDLHLNCMCLLIFCSFLSTVIINLYLKIEKDLGKNMISQYI